MRPLVSIIIPVYNAGAYLQRCIISIIKQNYSNLEIIIVDDGSTDNSKEIYELYKEKDNRIRTFKISNSGVSAARNIGLKNMTGQYVVFVDADDEIKTNHIETLLDGISHKDIAICMTGYCKINSSNNKIVEDTNSLQIRKEIDRTHFLIKLFKPTRWYLGYNWAKIFKSNIIKSNFIKYDENIYYNEDRLFLVTYLTHCKSSERIWIDSQSSYIYYQHSNSAINSFAKSFNIKTLTELESFVRILKLVKSINHSKYILSCIRYNALSQLFYIKGIAYRTKQLSPKTEIDFIQYFKIFTSFTDILPPYNENSKQLIKFYIRKILKKY